MDTFPDSLEHDLLATLVTRALTLADAIGLDTVALPLNDALERLTGRGIVPPMAMACLLGDRAALGSCTTYV